MNDYSSKRWFESIVSVRRSPERNRTHPQISLDHDSGLLYISATSACRELSRRGKVTGSSWLVCVVLSCVGLKVNVSGL